jgi:DNA mismatch repair ATPase MutS
MTIKSIPQGSLPAREIEADVEDTGPNYSITIQQHLNNMRKYPDCVVLTKLGNFYEMYFEHAEEFAPLLNLKLAKKPTVRNAGGFVYMAGFPIHQMDRYLKILVNDLGKHVAMSEEVRNDEAERMKSNGNMFDRKIVRIITPGTLIDEKFMDPWQNNFLLSIHAESGSDEVGLAWIDLSSGDFFTQKASINTLASAIARIGPQEVLLDQKFEGGKASYLTDIIKQGQYSISYTSSDVQHASAQEWLSLFATTAPGAVSMPFSDAEVAAGSLLVQYVNRTQLEQEGVQLQAPVHREENEYMMIDKHSLRALEITSTLRDGQFKGSLLQTIRRTSTQSGARLLAQRFKAPSMSLQEVNGRLDLVQEMIEYPMLRQEMVSLLKDSSDSLRLVSRFAFGRGDADDLLRLAKTVAITSQIAKKLAEHAQGKTVEAETARLSTRINRGKEYIQHLLHSLSLEQPQRLAERILEAIDEERLQQLHQIEDQESAEMLSLAEEVLEEAGESKLIGAPNRVKKAASVTQDRDSGVPSDMWIMRKTASTRLMILHKELDSLFDDKDRLEAEWRQKTGARKLSLKWMQPHGHVVHISGAKECAMDFSVLGKTTQAKSGKATKSFYHQEWTSLGNKIERVKELTRMEEQRVFDKLRKQVVKNIVKLRKNAAVLDELDVACGFATLAVEKHWVRPLLNNGTTHHIRGGRHPTVETGLDEQGKKFTSNDCVVGGNARILLITGPNMGGKSTFLRQNALLSILAQTGSFIPAEYAEIGLVDKIFSRVGSADNLYQDQSTFMVEMLETAEILKQATPKSFVIMDEVGRGTTPEDGIAVGFASLFHLYHVNRSRALFATHFHVLADMTKSFEELACYCTDVAEDADGSFSYVHKLRQGINRNPHALKVARLAGMSNYCTISMLILMLYRYAGRSDYCGVESLGADQDVQPSYTIDRIFVSG